MRTRLERSTQNREDQYDEEVSPEDFWEMVESKRLKPNNQTLYCIKCHVAGCWLDGKGNSFSEGVFS